MSAGLPGRGPVESARPEMGRARAGTTALLDLLQTGVALVAADWTIAYANPAFERLLGARVGGIAGRSLWDVLPACDPDALRAVRRDGGARTLRIARERSERGDAADLVDLRVGRDHDGGLVLELHPAHEEDARIREYEEFRDLVRRLTGIADSETLLASLAASAQKMCAADGAMVIEVHESEAEIVAGAGVDAHLPGTRFALAGSLTERVLAESATVAETEYQRDHPDFRLMTPGFEAGPALGSPLTAHGRSLGVLTVSRACGASPFTERESERLRAIADHASLALWKARMLEEAQAANEAKGTFLTTMSHELRTPLTALTGYGELLADEILGPLADAQLDVVERMRSVTHHLSVMIEEVLTYSSLEAGRERVRPRRFIADEVIHAAAAVIEPLARQKGLSVTLDLGSSPELDTDIDKVRQILVNLAGNAVKFTEHGGVEMSLQRCPGEVRFSVRDTGIGIGEADLRRLFHPFSQLDTGLTRRHGGTGLGLYISQRLAALLGGRIDVSSAPGEGSTFTLALPVGS